jgi:hypothetical protein
MADGVPYPTAVAAGLTQARRNRDERSFNTPEWIILTGYLPLAMTGGFRPPFYLFDSLDFQS